MADSALREKGREMRRKLLGDATVERIDRSVYNDPIMAKFAEVTQETIFGALWTRPGLDLKTRALICVISDAATGRDPELKLHLRMARNQGWTEDELVESLLHLGGYVGVPLIREALLVAEGDLRGDARREMSAGEAWRQTIAKAEVLLAEGEAAEDISVSPMRSPASTPRLRWRRAQMRRWTGRRRRAGCPPRCGPSGARIDDPVMLHSAMTACDHALEVYRPDTHARGLGANSGSARCGTGCAGRA